MRKTFYRITLLLVTFFTAIPIAKSQDVGATFCWHYAEIYGGHDDAPANQSIAKKQLPDGTLWPVTTQWWENMAEEIDYSGVDFIALLSRGNQPNAPDRGNGNPIHIPKMVNAMDARGCNFKLAIFDDCPNSWTGSKNWNESGGSSYSTTSPKFDCSSTANYKYIWDYNLKQAIGAIPDAKRYKIDGRMVIFFWSAKTSWMSNLQGNLSKILSYIKTQCQATYGFVPYLIVDKDWLASDNTLNTSTVDGVHGWFSSAGQIPYTLESWNGRTYGALCPGIRLQGESDFIDPGMGTTDMGKRLKTSLDNTVGAGARVTLVEGFTDAAENAALWRSTDEGALTYYNYANQRLNILRRYTSDPYPSTLKVEVEACDSYSDLTTGNSGGAFLYQGDLDVVKCTDTNGGWNVTATQANEWMEWKELPLLTNTKFQLRYKSSAAASIKFSVDGTSLSTISLPSTSGSWTTIDAGNYTTANNSLHTVRLTIVSGTPDINYFKRVVGTIAVTGVTLTPATATKNVGGTQQLTATVAPSNATNKTVTWSTSNGSVATVNSTGLVTAVAAGTATITVTTQDGGKTDVSVITVTVPVTGVTLSPATATKNVGGTQQLTATVAPSNATNKTVTWSTSNGSVATVNSTGLVTAIAAGTATITATTQDGGKTDTSVITVLTASNGIQILQAEDATVSGAVVATNQTGYYGTGFIDFTNATGDYVQWTINVPAAGTYDLSFRYSLLSGSRPLELKVNGVVKISSLDFPVTGSWSTWNKVITSQSLNAGNNTITLTTNGSNGGNVDELVVVPYIDDCDAITDWLTAGTNTLSYYTTDKKQGSGCVQMVGSGTDEFKKVFSPAYNSNVSLANGSLTFWYYVSDVTKCGTVRVELSSAGMADVDELSWPLSGLVNGWNKISLNLSDASQIGTPNLNALNWFRIYNTKTASITTRIDAIQLVELASLARAPKISTSVNDIETAKSKSINIYPNPFKQGKLFFDIVGFEDMNNIQVRITNLTGQTIYQEQLTNKSHAELNLSKKLNESVYFISVESGDTKVVEKLIVK